MTRLSLGSIVLWKDESWLLLDIPELNRVLLKHPETGRAELADINDLRFEGTTKNGKAGGLISVPQEEWKKALRQFEIIRPLLRKGKRERTYEEIDLVAHKLGKSRVTIYRWLNKIEGDVQVSSLLRSKRKDQGVSRLKDGVDEIINDKINNFYLVKERPSIVELWEQIVIACRERQIKPPSKGVVNRRVDRIQDRLVMAKRFSGKKARETFEPIRGSFPNADVPFAVYQVDHTPVDVIVVDDEYRRSIGRPYLSIVSDTCTRMLAGFCLTLDNPGALSVGLSLTHAILPKKTWLAQHEIDAEWPIYGIPQKIYADNAAEFRGTMLERACQEYGIIMENRPKGLPNYGGHIERLFRTFMKRVQSMPGTTFSNTQARGEYNSEGKAIFTLSEFEHWFGIFVTKVYHQRPHNGIGRIPPIKLYERFILGDDDTRSIGLPVPIKDERKLRLDFMPYEERTIQEYGVRIDYIDYYADVLRPWIHARDSNNPKLKRKFVFARDPRNISTIYFLDPDANQFFDVPYGNTTRPPMSDWELKAILKNLKEHPDRQADEDLIFEGLSEMRSIQVQAAEKSKVARRAVQRRKNSHENTITKKALEPTAIAAAPDWGDEVEPFEVVEAE